MSAMDRQPILELLARHGLRAVYQTADGRDLSYA
jgi:hypothetical protein